ncbi:transcription elongation factor GreA [Lactobacillus selangorensis]|uniref:Transcription elongation factor GreA n=1 Tax=Lactobacillus selangorensis TaxID=81857 RepID=A0A0R2FQG7_9LACO|nr:transcription elongation factor GreA [Lactobacillus selangorensis]KRN28597.1 transcription elongation factor GreA [Lactobacillus selangorensis]KRN32993.1 transcription elongation factor GreA [Lactobacillus selangorensis]
MEPTFIKMTANGKKQIEDEITALQQKRPALVKRLAAAAALGDRSENAEYSTSKHDLRQLDSRVHYLKKQLQFSQVITPANNQQVDLGSTVTIEFLDDHSTETYEMVGKQEADLDANKIYFKSPLGKQLMHHQVGQTVTIQAPASTYAVKIKTISA